MSRAPQAQPPTADNGARDLPGLTDLVRRRGPTHGDAISLTFDDGPGSRTEEAVDVLDAHGAKGTFFFVGEKVRGREAVLDRMLRAGHEIGNHSFHHLFHPSLGEIASASAQLQALTGVAPRLYRPPFGAIDRPTALAIREEGMTPVTWDVDSEDVFPVLEGLAPEGVHHNVIDRVRPGSIVLLHDGSWWSRAVEALPAMVETLLERGFRLVTVSELFAEAAAPSPGPDVSPERPTPAGDSRPTRARRWLARRAALGSWAHEVASTPSAVLHSALGRREHLETLKPREVLALLERQSGEDDQLGRAIVARVATNPVAFARLADRVLELDRAHLRWVLAGLAEAVVWTGALNWTGVLTLIDATLDEDSAGLEPARREAAVLLDHALGAGTVAREFAEHVWRVIERLSWSGLDATVEEAGDDREEQVRLSAMGAVMRYAAWAGGSGGLRALPEVRDNLDAHLDPAREPSEAVRGVYGSQLAQLLSLDRDWLAARISAILPSDPEHAGMRRAAWDRHLLWGVPGAELFRILDGEYRREVESLPAARQLRRGDHGDPGRMVARHLGVLLWSGAIDLAENGVLSAFLARSAPDDLAYLVKLMGVPGLLGPGLRQPSPSRTGRDDATVDEPLQRRLTALWEAVGREATRRAPEETQKILAPFGAWYAGGALEAGWLDAELGKLLSQRVLVEPVFRVLERLALRAAEKPGAAVELTAKWAELAGEWDLIATEKSLREIVRHALTCRDPSVRSQARALERTLTGLSRPSQPVDAGQSAFAP